jgi:hypothetical protein
MPVTKRKAAKATKTAKRSRSAPARRRPGPAPSGRDAFIGVRLSPEAVEKLDQWARDRGIATRSAAVRVLIERYCGD